MIPKRVATIAGSDTTGGAGMLADLKIFEDYDVFGLVALTCIVALNKKDEWAPSIHPISLSLLEEQLNTVIHAEPSVIKTGMIPTSEQIELVAKVLTPLNIPLVVDPVMACKRGDETQLEDIKMTIKQKLLPLATIATPNLIEASLLTKIDIHSIEDMKQAAQIIVESLHCQAVVIKGGTRLGTEEAVDVFYDGKQWAILKEKVISPSYNHGAGCTFAAAITAGIAQGLPLLEAVVKAKDVVTCAIKHSFKINDEISHIYHHSYFK